MLDSVSWTASEQVSPPEELGEALGYRFVDPELLQLALTHSSFAAEANGEPDNERLEFLGDAVLGLAITTKLYAEYPELAEGMLAKVRAAVVNEQSLARVARHMNLGEHLRIGRGEDSSGGRDKASILSDTLEAVLGAVYLDGSYHEAERVVLSLFGEMADRQATNPGREDYKTRLQELLAQRGVRPRYESSASGPDHERSYAVHLYIAEEAVATGQGSSKKAAEQEAARSALEQLGNEKTGA